MAAAIRNSPFRLVNAIVRKRWILPRQRLRPDLLPGRVPRRDGAPYPRLPQFGARLKSATSARARPGAQAGVFVITRLEPVPQVTIIVPTLNRAAVVQATVSQLLAQPFRDYELWIIDQSDETDAVSNRHFVDRVSDHRLHYLFSDVRNLPNARNEGLARTRSEIVLFLDDDVIILADDFIGAHLRAFADPAVGGVVGRHVERELTMNSATTACHVDWSGRTIFNLFGHKRTEVGSCKGSNMSFRMEAVRKVGGFDRRTSLLEETDFSTRVRKAGWRLVFEPEAELVHLSMPSGGVRSTNVLATHEQRFRSTGYYIRKHRGIAGVVPFAAVFILIAVKTAIQLRQAPAVLALGRALLEGVREGARPPEDWLPETAQDATGTRCWPLR